MSTEFDLSVVLLHDQMLDKQGSLITSSLTLIDLHDIARSAKTYALTNFYVAHPSPSMQRLARILRSHWQEGHGATYNPNRKDALELTQIVADLDEAIMQIDLRTGKLPKLIATSAREGAARISFKDMRAQLLSADSPFLLMLGTGWGMSEALLERADCCLEPVRGPGDYNHLSVRSACAIMLDRLFGRS